jgi:hypothetical protein
LLDGVKIQLIYRDYADKRNLLDSFDYTICQFLLYQQEGDINQEDKKAILCNPEAIIHLFEKD